MKREKNTKKLSRILKVHVSQLHLAILLKFDIGKGHLQYKNDSNSGRELRMHENHVLFLPVIILMVWCADFLGCMTHYHVS